MILNNPHTNSLSVNRLENYYKIGKIQIIWFRYLKIFLLISFPILFSQCISDEYEWMEYTETYSADPWDATGYDSEEQVMDAVERYYAKKDIHIYKTRMHFDATFKEDCEASTCTSGRIIKVKINECMVYELRKDHFRVY